MIIKDKEKSRAAGDSEKQQDDRAPRKYSICVSEDHLIAKGPKPPKDNEKGRNQVRFSERVNLVLQKECNNGDNYNDQRCMHLWHLCLVMTKVLVDISLKVYN